MQLRSLEGISHCSQLRPYSRSLVPERTFQLAFALHTRIQPLMQTVLGGQQRQDLTLLRGFHTRQPLHLRGGVCVGGCEEVVLVPQGGQRGAGALQIARQ